MDIVEQLRKPANIVYYQDGYTFRLGLQNEAADEIERLREALKNFCDTFEPHLHPERCQYCSNAYWEARAALKEGE